MRISFNCFINFIDYTPILSTVKSLFKLFKRCCFSDSGAAMSKPLGGRKVTWFEKGSCSRDAAIFVPVLGNAIVAICDWKTPSKKLDHLSTSQEKDGRKEPQSSPEQGEDVESGLDASQAKQPLEGSCENEEVEGNTEASLLNPASGNNEDDVEEDSETSESVSHSQQGDSPHSKIEEDVEGDSEASQDEQPLEKHEVPSMASLQKNTSPSPLQRLSEEQHMTGDEFMDFVQKFQVTNMRCDGNKFIVTGSFEGSIVVDLSQELLAIKENSQAFLQVKENLRNQQFFLSVALRENPLVIKNLDVKCWTANDWVCNVQYNFEALKYAPESVLKDQMTFRVLVQHLGVKVLIYSKLRSNQKFMLEMIKLSANAFLCLSDELKNNYQFVKLAVEKNNTVFTLLSPELQKRL